jgi:hypothetical protein
MLRRYDATGLLPTKETAMKKLTILLAVAGLFGATQALADSQYQRDRAACLAGETGQVQSACLQEAGAALQERRQGKLANPEVADYDRNRLARCDAQQGFDRELCIRRMNGEGTVTGSVKGGGLYRELVVTVPASN